ncbi:hypothetical protein [Prescottella sp. R16]|nr:hypothetical protein [Prescottella sp. R16]
MWTKKFHEIQARIVLAATADDGMSTAEYSKTSVYSRKTSDP